MTWSYNAVHIVAPFGARESGISTNPISMAMPIDGQVKAVAKRTLEFYQFIKDKPPAVGTDEVLMPGEPEIKSRQNRRANGIPVDDETISQIIDIAGKFKGDADQTRGLLQRA